MFINQRIYVKMQCNVAINKYLKQYIKFVNETEFIVLQKVTRLSMKVIVNEMGETRNKSKLLNSSMAKPVGIMLD